jgi:hypothetical protein
MSVTINGSTGISGVDGSVSTPVFQGGDSDTGIYFPTADNIGFATGGTIRGRWTTDGLCFNADTAAVNALDDYEEGTWTPTIIGTTAAGTATYSAQVARYTKIGNVVTATFNVNWSGHTGTGNMKVSGFPFNFANVSDLYFVASVAVGNLTITGVPVIQGDINATTATIYATNNGTTTALAMDTAAVIQASITYQTA